ncbi:FHA domain-containing protein [Streptomyces sp. NPDC088261]|uniref:protein kinase domain-containing protein n=1 Tax=Streptomyces sp. NPDC088261 TaxID=3365851 RepID=UPI0038118944
MGLRLHGAAGGRAGELVTVRVLVIVSVSGDPAEQAPAEYTYDEPAVCEVGLAPACAIRIGDGHGSVSGRHCRLEIDPPAVRLRDLGSRGGTYVNGRRLGRLEEYRIADGDEIRIGDVRLRVRTVHRPAPGGEPGASTATARRLLPDPPSAVLADYELLRELGRGSQGVVHLARHRGTGHLLALKQFLVNGTVDETARFALHRELESIRALDHPHIVPFRNRVHLDEQFWFTCEYCPGGSLERLAARHGGRIPPRLALPVAHQVLAALTYAHGVPLPRPPRRDGTTAPAHGLVHRDVKPANILLADPDPNPGWGPGSGPEAGGSTSVPPKVKLADFGLAKAFQQAGLSGHTRTGALGGTIPFTARAQLVDFKYAGPEVDVWAAAACLYWMLTGATPRDFPPGRDPIAITLREPVVRIRDRDPSVPPRLAGVIDAALVDTPRITIRSARELADALREAQEEPGRLLSRRCPADKPIPCEW